VRRGGAAPLAVALFAGLAGACGAGGPPPVAAGPAPPCASRFELRPAEASELLVEGARVFAERCSPCHGDEGYGDGVLADLLPVRPRNHRADPFKWGASWPDIEQTVRLGRSDVMPSFAGALTHAEIRSVSFLVACWVAQREPAE